MSFSYYWQIASFYIKKQTFGRTVFRPRLEKVEKLATVLLYSNKSKEIYVLIKFNTRNDDQFLLNFSFCDNASLDVVERIALVRKSSCT